MRKTKLFSSLPQILLWVESKIERTIAYTWEKKHIYHVSTDLMAEWNGELIVFEMTTKIMLKNGRTSDENGDQI